MLISILTKGAKEKYRGVFEIQKCRQNIRLGARSRFVKNRLKSFEILYDLNLVRKVHKEHSTDLFIQ